MCFISGLTPPLPELGTKPRETESRGALPFPPPAPSPVGDLSQSPLCRQDGGGAGGAGVLHGRLGAGAAGAGQGAGAGPPRAGRALPGPGLRRAARRLPALGDPLPRRRLPPGPVLAGLQGAGPRLLQDPRRAVDEAHGERIRFFLLLFFGKKKKNKKTPFS